MPTGVVMVLYLQDAPAEESRLRIAAELLDTFSLTIEDDFYTEGPLIFVTEDDYADLPLQGESGVWLNVNLWHSYYHVGYERGDLPLFIQLAEWLEKQFSNCRIFYGHDVTWGIVRPFDASARAKLFAYYNKVGHEPYYSKDWDQKAELRKLYEG